MSFQANEGYLFLSRAVNPEKPIGFGFSVFQIRLPHPVPKFLRKSRDLMGLEARMAWVCGKEGDGLGPFFKKVKLITCDAALLVFPVQ